MENFRLDSDNTSTRIGTAGFCLRDHAIICEYKATRFVWLVVIKLCVLGDAGLHVDSVPLLNTPGIRYSGA